MLYRFKNRSGVEDLGAHKFRHTFAIEYPRNGVEIYMFQYLLGHSEFNIVRRYIYFTDFDCGKPIDG